MYKKDDKIYQYKDVRKFLEVYFNSINDVKYSRKSNKYI